MLPHVVQPEDIDYWIGFDAVTISIEIPRGPGTQRITLAIPRSLWADLANHIPLDTPPPAAQAGFERWRDALGAHVRQPKAKAKRVIGSEYLTKPKGKAKAKAKRMIGSEYLTTPKRKSKARRREI